jgi:hypothetical protein
VGTFQEGRARLAELLQESLGKTWHVVDQPRTVDQIARPTIVLERDRVERAPGAPMGHTVDTFSLYMLDARTDDEDNLDVLLETVLDALDSIKAPWQSAARGVYKNQPGYVITLPLPARRKDNAHG